jgi:hypothetical protein
MVQIYRGYFGVSVYTAKAHFPGISVHSADAWAKIAGAELSIENFGPS